MDTTDPQTLAKIIADTWNKLAREKGWHPQKSERDVLNSPQLIKKVLQNLNSQNEALSKIPSPSPTNKIKTVLELWDWTKSPAPVRILTSPHLWQTITYNTLKQNEEKENVQQEIHQRLLTYVSKEWKKQFVRNLTASKTKAAVLEHLTATGKWDAISPTLRLEINRQLTELETIQEE